MERALSVERAFSVDLIRLTVGEKLRRGVYYAWLRAAPVDS